MEKDIRKMTSDTIGADILDALVAEVRLLPDVWPKLSQDKQDDIIERLRMRVKYNVRMAVHILAAQERTVIVGDLEQVTSKDGIKAVFKISASAGGRHELFDSIGQQCLLVIASHDEYTAGMNDITGDPDQQELNDLDVDDDEATDDDVVDADIAVIEYEPSADELKDFYERGYRAAAEGKTERHCPVTHGALCIRWLKGFRQCVTDRESEESDSAEEVN